MRSLLLITFITLFTVTNSDIVHAQEKSDSTSISDRSFLFQIGSNFKLTNFNGATFAFQKMVDEETANRFYISLNGNYTSGDTDGEQNNARFNDSNADTQHYSRLDTYTEDDVSVGLTIGSVRLKYHSLNDDVRYYGGLGLALNYKYDHRSTTIDGDINQTGTNNSTLVEVLEQEDEVSAHLFGIGPLLITGAEYALTDHLYLLAEYGFQVRYERLNQETQYSSQIYRDGDLIEDETRTTERTTNAVIFDSFPVRFGLRVNF